MIALVVSQLVVQPALEQLQKTTATSPQLGSAHRIAELSHHITAWLQLGAQSLTPLEIPLLGGVLSSISPVGVDFVVLLEIGSLPWLFRMQRLS